MRRGWRVRSALLAVVALLALPSPAAAGPLDFPFAIPPQLRALVRSRSHTQPHAATPASVSRFNLETHGGYRVAVIGSGSDVVVKVAKEGQKSLTAYIARGTVTRNRIEASFGSLGKISVRFQPSGQIRKSKPRRDCRGPDHFTDRLGVFAGSVQFAGEDNYLSLNADRAKGLVHSPTELHCAPSRGEFSFAEGGGSGLFAKGPKPALLAASWRHAIASTLFLALRGLGKKVLFLAQDERSEGPVATIHFAFAAASLKTFVLDNALTRASVSPPAPFSGSGTYSAAPDGTKTWSGSLSASFPGAPNPPLTGPQFETQLETGF